MYGTVVDHGAAYEFLKRSNRNFEMLRDAVKLLDCIERGVIEPVEGAYLMCPCNPSARPGYEKLIKHTEKAFQDYLDHIEACGCRHEPNFFAESCNRVNHIWGITEDEDDEDTIIWD